MKMPTPPENITLRLPGEAMDRLKAIQGGTKWKLEELAAKLFTDFLVETDLEGIAESPKQRNKKPSLPGEINGAEGRAQQNA